MRALLAALLLLAAARSAAAQPAGMSPDEYAAEVEHGKQMAEQLAARKAARGQAAADGDHTAPEHHPPPPVNWADFGWKAKDDHGGALGDGQIGAGGHVRPVTDDDAEEPMAPPFVLALLNFAIFAGILIKFGGPKISGYLAGRHDAIKKDLAEAAGLRKEAEAKLAEYSSRMAKVNAEVDQLIGEIRADAEAEKTRLLEDARTQAAALKKDAEERIASEIARARAELEREIVGVAVAAAEKLLREKATPADQQALFDGFVATLQPTAPGGTRPPGSPPPAADGGDSISKGWS